MNIKTYPLSAIQDAPEPSSQVEQEPAAWMYIDRKGWRQVVFDGPHDLYACTPLYLHTDTRKALELALNWFDEDRRGKSIDAQFVVNELRKALNAAPESK